MGPNCYVRCTVCGREEFENFAQSVRAGWPKCCGYTMRLERAADAVEKGMVDAAFSELRYLNERFADLGKDSLG